MWNQPVDFYWELNCYLNITYKNIGDSHGYALSPGGWPIMCQRKLNVYVIMFISSELPLKEKSVWDYLLREETAS